MKKIFSYCLILAMLLTAVGAIAEAEAVDYVPETHGNYDLTVASTTELSGRFFTDMWGYSTSDQDVRYLLHGYNLILWNNEIGGFQPDENVVSGIIVTQDTQGNRTYTMAINRELNYSDGSQITARDYVFSILLSMAPEMRAIGAQTTGLDSVVGAHDFKAGLTDVLAGVRLVDDYHFSVTVAADYYPSFYELSFLNYYPYPIAVIAPGCEVVDDGDGACIRNIDRSLPEKCFTAELLRETVLNEATGYLSHPSVVSGPYKLVSYAEGTADFEVNPYYKGNAQMVAPAIPRLKYTLAQNETMIEKLEAGEFDLINKCMNGESAHAGLKLTEGKKFVSKGYARSGLCGIDFCCERPAMRSKAVRQAIAHCLDKEELIDRAVGDTGLSVDGYYGLGQWMYLMVDNGELSGFENVDLGNKGVNSFEGTSIVRTDLNLDNLKTYELDVAQAISLLEADGWTLNEAGEAFDPEKDEVRCKQIEGELVSLRLTLVYPQGNAAGENMQDTFIDNLNAAGIALTLQAEPMPELQKLHYRQTERTCDMIYVATNFNVLFDPTAMFSPEPEYQGVANRTGIIDEKLYSYALAMRQVEPGDVVEYCRRWIEFQEYWTEVLPSIPVYSNVYYDFFTERLKDYEIAEDISWAQVIVPAYLESDDE